ncbi:MAG: hypothetical protein K2P93_08155 [Alphaproteobacteria bacterium]|nr:hypothetical protein [Alphaproteobacteria bacterium]
MIKRQRRSAECWKEVIEDFLKSGLSQQKYEQKHKICRATLRLWSKRLGIPLSQLKRSCKVVKEPPLSFIEVTPLGNANSSTPLLKLEVIFPQGHSFKLETKGTWEQAGSFIKSLMR